jgi:hypothetical protein
MINNIINNKNVKLYFMLILILLLLLFFLYLTKCYVKRENFEENNTSQENTISKNINNIEVPADFLPTHQWTNANSGLDILDNSHEHYLYENDEKPDKNLSKFTRNFRCRPSITGVFTDCGPFSFNACGPINSNTSHYYKPKDKKYRKHRNHKNEDEDISIFCDKNICHHIYHHDRRNWSNNKENNKNDEDYNYNKYGYRKINRNFNKNRDNRDNIHDYQDKKNNDSNVNSRNQDQLDYDEYINDLDGY